MRVGESNVPLQQTPMGNKELQKLNFLLYVKLRFQPTPHPGQFPLTRILELAFPEVDELSTEGSEGTELNQLQTCKATTHRPHPHGCGPHPENVDWMWTTHLPLSKNLIFLLHRCFGILWRYCHFAATSLRCQCYSTSKLKSKNIVLSKTKNQKCLENGTKYQTNDSRGHCWLRARVRTNTFCSDRMTSGKSCPDPEDLCLNPCFGCGASWWLSTQGSQLIFKTYPMIPTAFEKQQNDSII